MILKKSTADQVYLAMAYLFRKNKLRKCDVPSCSIEDYIKSQDTERKVMRYYDWAIVKDGLHQCNIIKES